MRSSIFFAFVFLTNAIFAQNNSISILSPSTGNVEIQDNNLLDFTSTLTLEAWIHLEDTFGIQSIVHKGWCGASENSYFFGISGGKLKHSWSSSATGNCNFSNDSSTENVVILPGICYHVAVVHGTSSVKFYVNGLEVASSILSGGFNGFYNSNEPLRLGIYRNLSGNLVNPINGLLDEVRIWDIARSSAEILNNKNIGLNGDEQGLIAYYKFDSQLATIGSDVLNSASTGAILDGEVMGPDLMNVEPACENMSFLSADNNLTDLVKSDFIVSLSPNPSNGNVILDLVNYSVIKDVKIIDSRGSVLNTWIPESNKQIISMSNLNSGIYFVRIESKLGIIENQKVVKN